jgi:hypothetical protein
LRFSRFGRSDNETAAVTWHAACVSWVLFEFSAHLKNAARFGFPHRRRFLLAKE